MRLHQPTCHSYRITQHSILQVTFTQTGRQPITISWPPRPLPILPRHRPSKGSSSNRIPCQQHTQGHGTKGRSHRPSRDGGTTRTTRPGIRALKSCKATFNDLRLVDFQPSYCARSLYRDPRLRFDTGKLIHALTKSTATRNSEARCSTV